MGKSTVCCNIVEHLTCTYGGMVSADIRIEGERVGFEIMDISTKERSILAHKDGRGPCVGKYNVNLEDLNNIGVKSINNALSYDLVVIDEIAPMEFKSKEFVQIVEKALESDRDMLVVLHQKSNHPLAQRIREEFEIYTVTEDNRESIVTEIINRIEKYEKSVIRQVLDMIAESVFDDLDSLDFESDWKEEEEIQQKDVDPEELASRMYDDVMESYLDVVREYQNNSRDDSGTIQCMGILTGIYKFENERMNDLFEWGLYDNHKKFKQVIEEWRKGNTDPRNLKEMDEFVMENFPEWHEDTLIIEY